MKYIKKCFLLILLMSMMDVSAFAANTSLFASQYFIEKTATLEIVSNTSMRLTFFAKAKFSTDTIGVSTVTVYDVTTKTSRTYLGKTDHDTDEYSDSFTFSAQSGHEYFAIATFVALDENENGALADVITNRVTV